MHCPLFKHGWLLHGLLVSQFIPPYPSLAGNKESKDKNESLNGIIDPFQTYNKLGGGESIREKV